jgi:hypothetical protein
MKEVVGNLQSIRSAWKYVKMRTWYLFIEKNVVVALAIGSNAGKLELPIAARVGRSDVGFKFSLP